DTELELQYLNIPVLARLQFDTPAGIGVFVNGGGFVDFLLAANSESDLTSDPQDISDDFESMNYGLAFGGGLLFPAGQGNIMVEARYNLGLANIAVDDNVVLDIPETNTRNLGLTVGYIIDL
ncbi:MAG: porin family protein, partial [Bacteroidota bacterium]